MSKRTIGKSARLVGKWDTTLLHAGIEQKANPTWQIEASFDHRVNRNLTSDTILIKDQIKKQSIEAATQEQTTQGT